MKQLQWHKFLPGVSRETGNATSVTLNSHCSRPCVSLVIGEAEQEKCPMGPFAMTEGSSNHLPTSFATFCGLRCVTVMFCAQLCQVSSRPRFAHAAKDKFLPFVRKKETIFLQKVPKFFKMPPFPVHKTNTIVTSAQWWRCGSILWCIIPVLLSAC